MSNICSYNSFQNAGEREQEPEQDNVFNKVTFYIELLLTFSTSLKNQMSMAAEYSFFLGIFAPPVAFKYQRKGIGARTSNVCNKVAKSQEEKIDIILMCIKLGFIFSPSPKIDIYGSYWH